MSELDKPVALNTKGHVLFMRVIRNMTEGFPSGTVSAMHVNGRHNWLVIGEFPNDKVCASAVLPLPREAACLISRRPRR
jgi:hypothetical protein